MSGQGGQDRSQRSDIMGLTLSAHTMATRNLFSGTNNSLFGGSSNSSFSGTGMMGGINYSDYASLRNGSYRKLLNSYYSMDTDSDSKTSSTSSTKKSGEHNYWDFKEARKVKEHNYWDYKTMLSSKESPEKLANAESVAGKLGQAADALLTQGSNSVFKMVEKTDAEGNKMLNYDKDAIYKAVSSFVDSYNNLIKDTKDSKVMAISASVRSIMDYTSQDSGTLASIGITVDTKDNTLVLNETKFKNSDMDTAKKLFQGTGSYAYKVSEKAGAVDKHAQYEASKANTYNNNGGYSNNYSSGNILSSAV